MDNSVDKRATNRLAGIVKKKKGPTRKVLAKPMNGSTKVSLCPCDPDASNSSQRCRTECSKRTSTLTWTDGVRATFFVPACSSCLNGTAISAAAARRSSAAQAPASINRTDADSQAARTCCSEDRSDGIRGCFVRRFNGLQRLGDVAAADSAMLHERTSAESQWLEPKGPFAAEERNSLLWRVGKSRKTSLRAASPARAWRAFATSAGRRSRGSSRSTD